MLRTHRYVVFAIFGVSATVLFSGCIIGGRALFHAASGNQCTWETRGYAFHSKMNTNGIWDDVASSVENVFVMMKGDSAPTAITSVRRSNLVSISPDGTEIVFESYLNLDGNPASAANPTFNIWIANIDGTNLRPLTQDSVASYTSMYPTWSPDGEHIIYSSTSDLNLLWADGVNSTSVHPWNIWVMDRDGSNRRALTQNTPLQSGAHSWTPSGGKFADNESVLFMSYMPMAGESAWDQAPLPISNIWIVNLDGSSLKALTRNTSGASGSFPFFGYGEGASVYFSHKMNLSTTDSSWDAGAAQGRNLWRVKRDGSDLEALTLYTTTGVSVYGGGVGRDQRTLVLSTNGALDGSWGGAEAVMNIWTLDMNAGVRIPLTENTSLTSTNAVLAPDGETIVMNSMTDPALFSNGVSTGWDGTSTQSYNLWTLNIDGSGFEQITHVTTSGKDVVTAGGGIWQVAICDP